MDGIDRAVITAAGSASRLLPFSADVPKAMLPLCARSVRGRIALRPVVDLVYESLFDAGCREFCLVVGGCGGMVEGHFERSRAGGSEDPDTREFRRKLDACGIAYARQPSPLGFGDAVMRARGFARNESFLVCAADDLVLSKGGCHIRRLAGALASHDADFALLVESTKDTSQYGVVGGRPAGGGIVEIEWLDEKPAVPRSDLAVVATYAFRHSIFDALELTEPDKNGEVQLSDAISYLVANGRGVAVKLEPHERRADVGTPGSYVAGLAASLERAKAA